MHLEYLEEFIELAQCLNFTEAARRSNVAQSSLSKHILVLEKEFRTKLLTRDKHFVELTPAGNILLQDALEIVSRYRSVKQRVSSLRSFSTLRIGGLLQNPKVMWTVASVLAQNENKDTDLTCSYHQVFSKPFSDLLTDRDIDILFAHQNEAGENVDNDEIMWIHLFIDQFVVVVSSSHPLAQKPAISLDELRDQTLIHLTGAYHSYGWSHIRSVCKNHGFDPLERSAYVQPGMDYSVIELRDDVFLLSQSSLAGQLFPRSDMYSCVPVQGEDAHFPIYVAFRKKNENQALGQFMQRLQEVKGVMQDIYSFISTYTLSYTLVNLKVFFVGKCKNPLI